MKTTVNKSVLFKMAWAMLKETGKSFAVCLARSWRALKLRTRMLKEEVEFAFEKVDGSLKRVTATLCNLPGGAIKGTGKSNFKSIAYWDIKAMRFGSFKVGKLIEMY